LSYNHENYLDEAIKSVVDQKLEYQLEIIISDDFSTDKSLQIIQKYQHNNSIMSNILPINKEIKTVNSVWHGDITYIRTSEGWLYSSVVLDSYSRKIAIWSFSDSLASNPV